MIDIGINLMSSQFDDDREKVLERALSAGVTSMGVTGTSETNSQRAAQFVRDHPHLWCTAGIHPHEADTASQDWQRTILTLAEGPQVKAIGETGLDFNRNYSDPDVQRARFDDHIQLALQTGLPLFVHDRDSNGAVHAMLAPYRDRLNGVVIHCFTGDADDLKRYVQAGYYIGITGWVCDPKRGAGLRQLVPLIPTERLVIETDAPYLLPYPASSPSPHKRRNEPCLLGHVAARIADLIHRDLDEVSAFTTRNATTLFRLPT
ncbi:MAG: TatD family hydrolase [Proteobacteria bacterium]|nr:TatD family hydrolase [Pseudomonadota bacterium]